MPAKSRIVQQAMEAKVFWFFSSEKNILPSLDLNIEKPSQSVFFSEEKNQKTFASARVRRYGTWPDRGVNVG